jgi:serine/threonine protein kinase
MDLQLASDPKYVEPGTQIGRYELIRRVAVGGMAEIFLARATGIEGFEKRVIIKRILPHLADSEEFVAMFLDEARLAATLHHANIAQVYDIGTDGQSYFFAMEYIEGKDVRHIRKELHRRHQDMPAEHAVSILLGVAAGLHAAHDRRGHNGEPLGLVHRDVSPSNVIVTFDGGVKLIDFGIAKAAQRQAHTRTGVMKGKSAYMSPEQWLGERIDRRSDVFSLGVLLFELTLGERLFKKGAEYETMRALVKGRPLLAGRLPPAYPEQLERILHRALERHPEERYQTAQAFYLELERYARNERLFHSQFALAEWVQRMFPSEAPGGGSIGPPLTVVEPDSGPMFHSIDTAPRASTTRDGEVSNSELTSGEFEVVEDMFPSTAEIDLFSSTAEITIEKIHVCDGVEVKFTEKAEESSTFTMPRTRIDIPVTRIAERPREMVESVVNLAPRRSRIAPAIIGAAIGLAAAAVGWQLWPAETAGPAAPAALATPAEVEPEELPATLARPDLPDLAPFEVEVPAAIASTDWKAKARPARRFAKPKPAPKPAAVESDEAPAAADAEPAPEPAAKSDADAAPKPKAPDTPQSSSESSSESDGSGSGSGSSGM